MDLALNEIQTLLQNSAREFLEAEMPKSKVLEIDDSPSGFSKSSGRKCAKSAGRVW